MGLPVTHPFSFHHDLQKKFTGSVKEMVCISFRYNSWFFGLVNIFWSEFFGGYLMQLFMMFLVVDYLIHCDLFFHGY